MVVDEDHYECGECGEVIKPAIDPPYTPKSVRGTVSATISGPLPGGTWITGYLMPDEIDRVMNATEDEREAVLADLVANLPSDQITEMRSQ